MPDPQARAAEIILRLAARVRQDMGASFAAALDSADLDGLTSQQARTLGFIEANEAAGLSQREMADATGTRAASVSKLVGSLERDGWIERVPDPADARRKLLRVTPRGRAVVKRFEEGVWAGVTVDLTVLSDDEREELLRLLTKVDAGIAG